MFWLITERIVHVTILLGLIVAMVSEIIGLFKSAVKTRKFEEENGAIEKEEDLDAPTKEAYDNLCNDYDLLERQYNDLLDVCTTASVMRDVYKSKLERVKQENEHLQRDKEILNEALLVKKDG